MMKVDSTVLPTMLISVSVMLKKENISSTLLIN